MSRTQRHPGFTLVELLVVVLIVGILAAIALPRFLGQRTRAKNSASQAAVRHALLAARSYYTQSSESYVGLGAGQLQGYESSLSGSEAPDGRQAGDSANPQEIWIGNGIDGTNPNTVAAGDPNGGNTVVLCSASRGDTVYCVKDVSGVASYLRVTTSGSTVAAAAGGSYSATGWDASTPATTPATCGGLGYSGCVLADNPTWYWRFNDTGTTAANLGSGSGSLNLTSVSTGVAGALPSEPANKAFGFPNNTDSARVNYGLLAPTSPTSMTGSYTLEAWIQLANGSTGGSVFSSRNHPNDWGLNLQPSVANYLCVNAGTGSSWLALQCPTSSNWAAGTWYMIHLVMTSTSWTTYVNGTQTGTGTFASATPLLYSSTRPLMIGATDYRSNGTGPLQGFLGNIDEVAIYPTALSAARILAHYQAA